MKHHAAALSILFFILAGTTGCHWFRGTAEKSGTPEDPGLISAARADEMEKNRMLVCLYPAADVYLESAPDTPEIRDLRRRAAAAGFRVEFRPAAPGAIPAKLRAGKGDIAAGNYTASYAANRYLGFIPSGETTGFLIRADDPLCPGLLCSGEK